MPVNQNVTIYLPLELATRVAEAKEAGTLDLKEVCKSALEHALEGDRGDSQDTPKSVQNEVYAGPPEVAYELTWAGNDMEGQAKLDHITNQGGWPVSHSVDKDGRISMLVAWPLTGEAPS